MPRTLPISGSVMSESIRRFDAGMKRFADTLKEEQLVVFYKRLSLEILRKVVFLTPVDTGRARGNWQLTISTPASGQVKQFKGRDPFAAGTATLEQMKNLNVVWISNNVPYIVALERGWSKQAPAGMVAVTLDTLSQMFEKSLSKQASEAT